MRKFDLCFQFADEDGLLLIPELLTLKEPDVGWGVSGALQFQYHYSVLPSGLIPRFIVRTHHLLTKNKTYWRSGVVLATDECRILIRGDTHQGIVFIEVQGSNGDGRRKALAIVRDHFQAIHSRIPRLEARAKVPLPDDPDAPPVDYDYLCKLRDSGVESQLFDRATKEYLIHELLSGVDESRYDVFLSHNSADKSIVREVAKQLRMRGLRPWLDVEQLTPGQVWKQELIGGIEACQSIAVFVGGTGFGPWELEESRIALDEAVHSKKSEHAHS